MKVTPTHIPDLLVIEPTVHGDERGYFYESYNVEEWKKAGLEYNFIQDNQAGSGKGVLRGLHFQKHPHAQTKLVRALSGEIYDVAVDLRPDSNTRGQSYGIILSADNKKQLLIPRGFAHGYLVLSDFAEVTYKVDNVYAKDSEGGLRYDDPALGIAWPDIGMPPKVNERDRNWPLL